MVFYCPLTRKCWKRRTTGSFNLAKCLGLTLITVTTKIMEFNLLSLELKYERKKDKTKINQITWNLFCIIAAKRVSWESCEFLYPSEADG